MTATANPTEGGTVTGSGTYNHGTTATLTATANEGYYFVNWTKNGTQVSTSTSCSVTVEEAATYTANFELYSYEITATANPTAGGSVTGGGTYNHGATTTLTATPATGYTFANWTLAGVEVSSDATYTFTVTADGAYTANFALNSYTLTINYKYENGTQAAEPHTETLNYNNSYSVTSPSIANYAADITTVAGTMGTNDVVKNVTYYLVETSIVDASNCSGTGNGSITVTAPTGNFEYSIDGTNYQSSNIFNDLNANDYTLYIRPTGDVYNYVGEWSVGLVITMPTAEISSNDSIFCLNSSIQLSGEGSSTGSNYSYEWTGPSSYSSTDMNPTAFSASDGNMTGTYTLTVTNTTTQCASSKSLNIYINHPTNPNYVFTISGYDAVANIELGEHSTTVNMLPPTVTHFLNGIVDNYINDNVTITKDSSDTYTVPSGTVTFPITYPVTWTATDECGNTATCVINVTIYGEECTPVQDIDGNIYQSVKIGTNCWMTENMRTTRYADGRPITNIYQYNCSEYPNVTENVSTYGLLYDWYDALDSNITRTRSIHKQGICPNGWYIPSEEEFAELHAANLADLRSIDYWMYNPGTNASGYDLRPGGYYNFSNGRYENLHGNAYLWSATSASVTEAHCHMADCNCYMIIDLITHKNHGFSVRCVKE